MVLRFHLIFLAMPYFIIMAYFNPDMAIDHFWLLMCDPCLSESCNG